MSRIFISVGSNVNKNANMISAQRALEAEFNLVKSSAIYESESVGFEGENFYNSVVSAETDRSITEVTNLLRQIETAHNRVRKQDKFSNRTLDLDLLLYDDKVCESPIQLPRGEILQHAFVLLPLTELAANQIHPVLKVSYKTLWQEFDHSQQALWTVNLTE